MTVVRQLDADAIDVSSPSLFWASDPDPKFLLCMEQEGQLEPVLVCEKKDTFLLLAGYKRVKALQTLDLPVQAKVMDDRGPRGNGMIYLLSNLGQELSISKQVRALRYFSAVVDQDDLHRDILPLLDINPQSRTGEQYLAMLDLSSDWDELFAKGHLPLESAAILRKFSEQEQYLVRSFFSDLRWSKNNALKWLEYVWEKARADTIPLGSLLEDAGFTEVLASELSPKDRIARLVGRAEELRYPLLLQMEKDFASRASSITRGTGWRISKPDRFETGDVLLTVRVRNRETLVRAVEELRKMASRDEWEGVWEKP